MSNDDIIISFKSCPTAAKPKGGFTPSGDAASQKRCQLQRLIHGTSKKLFFLNKLERSRTVSTK